MSMCCERTMGCERKKMTAERQDGRRRDQGEMKLGELG